MNPSGAFFTVVLRSFILLRKLEFFVEPPWSEAVQKGTTGARGGLPLVIHTQAWSSLREEGLRYNSGHPNGKRKPHDTIGNMIPASS